VPRGVDDVHPDLADLDRGLLGEDRDALLALQVHRVHHAIDDRLVLAERPRLAEHRVDERGLAVVDVGDDRDVAKVASDGRAGGGLGRAGGHGWAGILVRRAAECRTGPADARPSGPRDG
jgi:hypothetical protein